MHRRAALIEAIHVEIERIFGSAGLAEGAGVFEWLHANYGVTELDHVQFGQVIDWQSGRFGNRPCSSPAELADRRAFLEANEAVVFFLERLLARYQDGAATYPARITAPPLAGRRGTRR